MLLKWLFPDSWSRRRTLKVSKSSRVAIVGAGVGGATTAFFLKEALGNQVHIDV